MDGDEAQARQGSRRNTKEKRREESKRLLDGEQPGRAESAYWMHV